MILQMMLDNSDRISAQIAALDARIEEAIGPFCRPAARLAEIPGVSTVAAAELIAEIGVDMTGSPRPRIWCRGPVLPAVPPVGRQVHQQGPRQGQPVAGRHPWPHRVRQRAYRHLPGRPLPAPGPRCGRQKALVATGNSVLTVIYHLLSDPDARFCDLGPATTNSGSTSIAAPATWPPNSKRSPASTSPFATAKRSSPTPPPDPKPTAAQHDPAPPGAFGLPTHHPIFGSAPRPSRVTPRRRENGVGSPADADVSWVCEPVDQPGAGARPGRVTHCCFEHAGQNFGSLDRGPRATRPLEWAEAVGGQAEVEAGSRRRFPTPSTSWWSSGCARSMWPRRRARCACGCRGRAGRRVSRVWDVPARSGAVTELAEHLVGAGDREGHRGVHLGLRAT